MCEEPLATAAQLDAVRAAVAEVDPELPVIATVLRPRPVEPIAGRRVAFFSTAPDAIHPRLREHVERDADGGRPSTTANGSVEGLLMRLDQQHWLPGNVLAKADRASMQVSLELRTPYLHRELAEFAATVAPSTHVSGGGKVLLRRVLERVLPRAAHDRAKVAFRTPTAEWLRGPLAPALREQLASSALYADGWFRRDAVRRLVEEHQSGAGDRTKALWPVFVLGTWLDRKSSS
jgi:hypothetical protein